MENNLESKAKFFAQYWAQRVGFYDKFSNWIIGGHIPLHEIEYLQLKHLSSITDEDAKSMGFRCAEHFNIDGNPYGRKDELRALGYAIEWHDVEVEEQITRGWIKLKTE